MADPDYNQLSEAEQEKITDAIESAMCSMNGDTGTITITARQARILCNVYALTRSFAANASRYVAPIRKREEGK